MARAGRSGGGPPPTYSTTFAAVENPLSEGGAWARNQANLWTNVKTLASGVAVGTQVDSAFDDSYAILQGDWGSDYKLTATIFRSASISAVNHEVELSVRFLDDADSVRGYEVLLNHEGAFQCFRWNDSFGDFTEVVLTGNTVGVVPDGAVFEVQIIGDAIIVRYDAAGGTPTQQCTGDIGSIGGPKYTTGNPAIAFFCRPTDGANPEHFGFHSITVTKL
jgi:hypothetical protein